MRFIIGTLVLTLLFSFNPVLVLAEEDEIGSMLEEVVQTLNYINVAYQEASDNNDSVTTAKILEDVHRIYESMGKLTIEIGGIPQSSFLNIIETTEGKFGLGIEAPTEKLEVLGNVKVSGDLYGLGDKKVCYEDGTNCVVPEIPKGINITETEEGRFGFGTMTPTEKLEVLGNVKVSGDLYGLGDKKVCYEDGTNCVVPEIPKGINITETEEGKFGFGTETPTAKLHIKDASAIAKSIIETTQSNGEAELTFRRDDQDLWSVGNTVAGSFKIANNVTGNGFYITKDDLIAVGKSRHNTRLNIDHSPKEDTISQVAISGVVRPVITKDTKSYDKAGFFNNIYYSVPAGIKDGGYKIGIDASSYSSLTSFAGTLRSAYGLWSRSGIYKGTAGAKIENAFAVNAQILNNQAGTIIDNAYGVFINNNADVGTITNRYDLYASSSLAKSYFAGTVGIGTTNPTEKLEVVGNIKSSGELYGLGNKKVCYEDGTNCNNDLQELVTNLITTINQQETKIEALEQRLNNLEN